MDEPKWGQWGPPLDRGFERVTLGRINKRAHALAMEAFERYREEMREAFKKHRIESEQIDSWRPATATNPTTEKV